MTSIEVLCEMERKLDELIANATLLKDCEEEKGKHVDLEHKQEMLLNALLKINNSLNDSEKHLLWQKSPQVYSTLEKKIVRFSRLNQTLLKKERFVKKARVHRRKIKKPPTQLSLDLN